ncbi:MAG: hypothetical protein NVSMB39_0290 [Candidatus Saccharimonadales bacterium]
MVKPPYLLELFHVRRLLMKKTYTLSQLFADAPIRSFRRKTVIFDEKNPADGLYRIISGRIKVSAVMDDGQILIMNTVGPGDPFPLPLYFLTPAPRIIYTAETNVTAHWSARPETDVYLHAHPEVLYELIGIALKILYTRINTLSRNTAEKKVIQLLIELSQRFGKPGENLFEITTTQQDMADSVNLSRESVNIILNKLAGKAVLKMSRNKIFMDISKAKAELRYGSKVPDELYDGAAAAEAGDLDLM